MKPICIPCERFYRPLKNGVFFTEGMPIGNDAKPGLAEPERWRPYKLWCGDKWRCPDCGHELISGVGHSPVSEHYLDDFTEVSQRCNGDKLLIKDC
jgi:hypothetical protein